LSEMYMRNRVIIYLLNTIIYCICSFTSDAQKLHFPIINYTTKDYNAHSYNWGVVQDQNGILYFGNVGLLEFDGFNWNLIPSENSTSLFSIDINSNGIVFAGGIGEFGYYKPDVTGSLSFVSLSYLLPDSVRDFNNVWKTHVIKDKVFFNSFYYLFLYENGVVKTIFPPDDLFSGSFVINDQLWITDRSTGIWLYQDDGLIPIAGSQFFSDKEVKTILPYDDDRVLVGTASHGLFLFTHNSQKGIETIPFSDVLNSSLFIKKRIYGGIRLHSGNFAIYTTDDGIYLISVNGKIINHISREEGLIGESVTYVYQDKQGNLWCTLQNGIACIQITSPVSVLREGKGYNGEIESMIAHGDDLYFATSNAIYRIRKNREKESKDHTMYKNSLQIEKINGISAQCWNLLSINTDLLATTGRGVYQITGTSSVIIDPSQAFSMAPLLNDSSKVLVGCKDRLLLLGKDHDKWGKIMSIENLNDYVISITEIREPHASDDSLYFWLGLWNRGVLKISFNRNLSEYAIKEYTVNDGLPKGHIRTFYFQDAVVFASEHGICRYNSVKDRFFC